ncbi:MAG: hypothetical protein WCK77_25210 [Verrucomicrobiota bacterium]
MNVHVTRYGSRNWAVWIDGDLLAVTVYRKGARAIQATINDLTCQSHVTILEDAPNPGTGAANATAGLAADQPG